MPGKRSNKDSHLRQSMAQQAAKYMLESGCQDYALAKRKAAAYFGVSNNKQLPTNQEIEQARIDYQALFHRDSQPAHLSKLRRIAVNAMAFLADFQPRLVGPVLSGSADQHSPVTLHVFTDTAEDINFLLLDRKIPFEVLEKRVKHGHEQYEFYPCYQFFAEQQQLQLIVFPLSKRCPTPLSKIDGKPIQRATIAEVRALLADEQDVI